MGKFRKAKAYRAFLFPTIWNIPQQYHSERTFTFRQGQGMNITYEQLFLCSTLRLLFITIWLQQIAKESRWQIFSPVLLCTQFRRGTPSQHFENCTQHTGTGIQQYLKELQKNDKKLQKKVLDKLCTLWYSVHSSGNRVSIRLFRNMIASTAKDVP